MNLLGQAAFCCTGFQDGGIRATRNTYSVAEISTEELALGRVPADSGGILVPCCGTRRGEIERSSLGVLGLGDDAKPERRGS